MSDLTIRELAEIFYDDCTARNLQPSTIRSYRRSIGYLVGTVGERLPATFTPTQLQLLLLHYFQARRWSIGSANHAITAWKALFNFLLTTHVIDQNPMAGIEKMRGAEYLPVPYSDDEIHRLLAILDDTLYGVRNLTMFLILLDTGIRLGELMGIHMRDLSLEQRHIRVFGKGRKERIVTFSTLVACTLRKYLQARESLARTDALWITDGGTLQSTGGFIAQFSRIASMAGVEKAHIHRFRHTFATSYLRNGGNPLHLQHLLGHTTPVMTQRYTHLTDQDAFADHEKASPVTRLLGM